MSYDDYASLPEDGIRYELSSGKLEAMSPSPGTIHIIARSLYAPRGLLRGYDRTIRKSLLCLLFNERNNGSVTGFT